MYGVRRVMWLAAVCALLVPGGSDAAAVRRSQPLLALVGNGTTESLAWLDPVTLKPIPGRPRLYVGLHDIPHAF